MTHHVVTFQHGHVILHTTRTITNEASKDNRLVEDRSTPQC